MVNAPIASASAMESLLCVCAGVCVHVCVVCACVCVKIQKGVGQSDDFYMRACKCPLFTDEGRRRLLKCLNYCFDVLASATTQSTN